MMLKYRHATCCSSVGLPDGCKNHEIAVPEHISASRFDIRYLEAAWGGRGTHQKSRA